VAVGTGRALVDIAVLRHAMRSVRPDGTVQLVGTFNLTGCVACVLIRDGITVEGADARGGPANATLVGGSFPLIIAVRDRGPRTGSGNMTLRRLHFTGQLLNAVYFFKTVAETRFLDNTITNLIPVVLADGRRAVRSPVVAAQFWPNGAGPGREEILQRFPVFARVAARFGGEFHLQGNMSRLRHADAGDPMRPWRAHELALNTDLTSQVEAATDDVSRGQVRSGGSSTARPSKRPATRASSTSRRSAPMADPRSSSALAIRYLTEFLCIESSCAVAV
jgi:hypothetical protein